MSGKKQYHVDMSEWFRTRVAAPLARWAIDDSVMEEVRRRAMEGAQDSLGEMRDRQERVEQVVAGFSTQTRLLEQETNRRLREHGEELTRRMLSADRELRRELSGRLAERERALRAEIAAERGERHKLEGRLDDLEGGRRTAAQAAAATLAEAGALRDLIAATYPHERYEPGRLTALEQRFATVERNLAQGTPEAALGLAQTVYHELSDLRVTLELRHREWSGARSDAAQELDTVRAMIERDMDVSVAGMEGAEQGVRFDLGHWSMGELEQLRAEVAAAYDRVRDRVHDEAGPLGVEELREIVESTAPRYRERWSEIAERAERRLLASQIRVNLADFVVTRLDQFAGFLLLENETGYAGQDQREAFYAKLRHPGGDEIVIEVVTAESDDSQNTLRVISYDEESGSLDQRLARSREITAHLRANGVHVSDPETEPGAPDPVLREMRMLRGPAGQERASRPGTFHDEAGR
ncbi:hypothetical protein AB0C28_12165 [Nonomuraea sp. NPDC048892]|uniref:hypothetical protein n=1 Tax=Nonomuraea sp. NPDC048892 TaxID=3154624 RepID=UPI0033F6050A